MSAEEVRAIVENAEPFETEASESVKSPFRLSDEGVYYQWFVRDGLTHRERIVLWCLSALQKEHGNRHVPTGMLYGSVVE